MWQIFWERCCLPLQYYRMKIVETIYFRHSLMGKKFRIHINFIQVVKFSDIVLDSKLSNTTLSQLKTKASPKAWLYEIQRWTLPSLLSARDLAVSWQSLMTLLLKTRGPLTEEVRLFLPRTKSMPDSFWFYLATDLASLIQKCPWAIICKCLQNVN